MYGLMCVSLVLTMLLLICITYYTKCIYKNTEMVALNSNYQVMGLYSIDSRLKKQGSSE